MKTRNAHKVPGERGEFRASGPVEAGREGIKRASDGKGRSDGPGEA